MQFVQCASSSTIIAIWSLNLIRHTGRAGRKDPEPFLPRIRHTAATLRMGGHQPRRLRPAQLETPSCATHPRPPRPTPRAINQCICDRCDASHVARKTLFRTRFYIPVYTLGETTSTWKCAWSKDTILYDIQAPLLVDSIYPRAHANGRLMRPSTACLRLLLSATAVTPLEHFETSRNRRIRLPRPSKT